MEEVGGGGAGGEQVLGPAMAAFGSEHYCQIDEEAVALFDSLSYRQYNRAGRRLNVADGWHFMRHILLTLGYARVWSAERP